jgi:hypothetical protein
MVDFSDIASLNRSHSILHCVPMYIVIPPEDTEILHVFVGVSMTWWSCSLSSTLRPYGHLLPLSITGARRSHPSDTRRW